jgi:hypothetical protein
MPAITYFAELDRINAQKALGPVILDMSEHQLKVALLYVLHGIDVYDAIDSARAFPRDKS